MVGHFKSNKFEKGTIIDVLIEAEGFELFQANVIVEDINPDILPIKLKPLLQKAAAMFFPVPS